jgi:uncharacterized membrane protein YdjX (TVP38/TMEM64 family)
MIKSADDGAVDEKPPQAVTMAASPAESENVSGFSRKIVKKVVLLVGALLVMAAITSLPAVRHVFLENQIRLKQVIHDCGPWGPVAFTSMVAILVGSGFPRLALHFLGGTLFAFWGGLLWSSLGTMIGYTVIFIAVRQLGLGNLILRRYPAWQKLTVKLKRNSVPAVVLFRQIPLPGMVANVVLGLSPIRRRDFFLGTCIGLLPEAIPMVLIGSGLRKEDLGQTVIYLFGAMALFIAIWVLWGSYGRRTASSEGN